MADSIVTVEPSAPHCLFADLDQRRRYDVRWTSPSHLGGGSFLVRVADIFGIAIYRRFARLSAVDAAGPVAAAFLSRSFARRVDVYHRGAATASSLFRE